MSMRVVPLWIGLPTPERKVGSALTTARLFPRRFLGPVPHRTGYRASLGSSARGQGEIDGAGALCSPALEEHGPFARLPCLEGESGVDLVLHSAG